MSDIRPIDLPTAAGVEFGRGDVRHFSEDDAVDVVGLQTPTRHLAERDNLLASKLNEVVGVVNNKEQFVPLPIPRTVISPGSEEVVCNFKIPEGYEARVLNAAVGTVPTSSSGLLKVYYATGYGNTTGTELVSTTSTFSSGVAFYNTGEFIVALRNTGALNLEVSASVTLTVRPLGSTASLLVGSVVRGEKGYRGEKGEKGSKGDPGVGGAGSPGLVWTGAFSAASSYAPPQAVSYSSGGVTQSYICKLANPAPSVSPPNGTYWDLIAGASATPAIAPTQPRWMGVWSALTTYVNDSSYIDIVSRVNGGITSSYICKVASSLNEDPLTNPASWDVFASPGGETPTYDYDAITGAGGYTPQVPYITFGGTYSPGTTNSGYLAVSQGTESKNQSLTFDEWSIRNSATTPVGVAFLSYKTRMCFKGDIYVRLPDAASGASLDWLPGDVHCIATLDAYGTETANVYNLGTEAVRVTESGTTFPAATTLFHVNVDASQPRNVSLSFVGIATVPP